MEEGSSFGDGVVEAMCLRGKVLSDMSVVLLMGGLYRTNGAPVAWALSGTCGEAEGEGNAVHYLFLDAIFLFES